MKIAISTNCLLPSKPLNEIMDGLCEIIRTKGKSRALIGSCYRSALNGLSDPRANAIVFFSLPDKPHCVAHAIAVTQGNRNLKRFDTWSKMGGEHKHPNYIHANGEVYPMMKRVSKHQLLAICEE